MTDRQAFRALQVFGAGMAATATPAAVLLGAPLVALALLVLGAGFAIPAPRIKPRATAPRIYARQRQSGQGLVEYALILGLIALIAIVGLTVLGSQTNSAFCTVSGAMGGSGCASASPGSVASNVSPATAGTGVTLTATNPGGSNGDTVTFFRDGVSIGTGTLSGGTATLSYTFGGADTYAMTASDGAWTAPVYNLPVNAGPGAPLHVTASSPTFTHGNTPPAITPSYSGLTNGDTQFDLNPQPTCRTTATAASPPGFYPSMCYGGGNSAGTTYSYTYINGTVHVL